MVSAAGLHMPHTVLLRGALGERAVDPELLLSCEQGLFHIDSGEQG